MSNNTVYILKVQGGDNKFLQNLVRYISNTYTPVHSGRQYSSGFIDYLHDCPQIGTRTLNISLLSYSTSKSQRDALFLKLIFDRELYIFRIDLLFVVRSLNTLYTAIGICHAEVLKEGIKNKFEK